MTIDVLALITVLAQACRSLYLAHSHTHVYAHVYMHLPLFLGDADARATLDGLPDVLLLEIAATAKVPKWLQMSIDIHACPHAKKAF